MKARLLVGPLRCSYRSERPERDGIWRMRCVLPFWHRWGNPIHLMRRVGITQTFLQQMEELERIGYLNDPLDGSCKSDGLRVVEVDGDIKPCPTCGRRTA